MAKRLKSRGGGRAILVEIERLFDFGLCLYGEASGVAQRGKPQQGARKGGAPMKWRNGRARAAGQSER